MNFTAYDANNTEEISQLFNETFTDSEGADEGQVIGELTKDLMSTTDSDDLFIFVATEDNKLAGSIIFSRLTFETGIDAFILSPVAVHPDFQRQGVGQKLIKFGLETLARKGVELAFTYGDPNYYSKVGFKQISEDIIKAPLAMTYPEGWLGQSLTADALQPISGRCTCVSALNNAEYW
ncbi:N-acetyltransferase [Shewanella schlegeliana]|uniref:N-acetyltransferase n=1 Tax=Shewanella schlegeliana TaxID=190308 RepID=A0ABS1SUP6_9GAMM|nr:N-acetyltransferase [Shewanella schlegeliana]MBL4912271.1 N-acetyltransferase [Shewanella schlegeliana]MCL1108260.1 N-acetyltransferase [Shewanella schlegeliana]GIU22388.1 N-acetyltransferase [Shewanella schlegeliana]